MSLWTAVKILAALAVTAVLGATGILAYHVTVRPVKQLEKVVPNAQVAVDAPTDAEFVKMVDSAEMPDTDPGERAYQKAVELIAMGDVPAARAKLTELLSHFPTSSCAGEARHIIGQMNLDDWLDPASPAGKMNFAIKRGDSYLGIAAKCNTTLDSIFYLNNLDSLKPLMPGEELLVMRLDLRVVIDPALMTVSLWDGDRFFCEYPIKHMGGAKPAAQTVAIQSKAGQIDARSFAKPAKKRPGASPTADPAPAPPRKAIQLAKVSLRIAAWHPEDASSPGIFLDPGDFDELFLLTRTGNPVEIRAAGK